MPRDTRQIRCLLTELKTRAVLDSPDDQDMVIEGYFAVFNQKTELWPGAFEEIAPGAFTNSIANDIRALTNHDTTLVLGRTKSGTLELKEDSRGLWGAVRINQNDTDAVNVYERVKRGDVDQCSFGFNIVQEETNWNEDGTVLWRMTELDLKEVTVCTFPQYEQTGIQARQAEVEQHKGRQLEQRKNQLIGRLRKNGN